MDPAQKLDPVRGTLPDKGRGTGLGQRKLVPGQKARDILSRRHAAANQHPQIGMQRRRFKTGGSDGCRVGRMHGQAVVRCLFLTAGCQGPIRCKWLRSRDPRRQLQRGLKARAD